MLIHKQLFSITTIFFIIISGCSPSSVVDSTPTATLSVATETREPSPTPTTIPSATATPIPINVRESLELAQEIAQDAESIAFGYDEVAYAFNETGNVVATYDPESNTWKPLPFSEEELIRFSDAKSEFSKNIILNDIRVGKVFDLGLPGEGAIEIGNGYHILQMFEAFWLDDDGNIQMALVPSITQSNDGTIIYGMVAFANLADFNPSFERIKILAAESNFNLYPNAIQEGYDIPSDDYWVDTVNQIMIELSTGDHVSIRFPRTNFVSDLNRKEMLRIIKASLPHFVQLLNNFSDTGSLEDIKALDPSKVPILPAIGVQIDEDVRKP
jgi:hypothetical protein